MVFFGMPIVMGPGMVMAAPVAMPTPALYQKDGRLFLDYPGAETGIGQPYGQVKFAQPLLAEAFRSVSGAEDLPKPASFWDVLRFVIFGRSFESDSDTHSNSGN